MWIGYVEQETESQKVPLVSVVLTLFYSSKTRKTDICTLTFVKRAQWNQENQLEITNLRLLWYAVYYLDQASFFSRFYDLK